MPTPTFTNTISRFYESDPDDVRIFIKSTGIEFVSSFHQSRFFMRFQTQCWKDFNYNKPIYCPICKKQINLEEMVDGCINSHDVFFANGEFYMDCPRCQRGLEFQVTGYVVYTEIKVYSEFEIEEQCEECGEEQPPEEMEYFEGRHLCDDCVKELKEAENL